jgi:hypothetical protein
VRREAIRRGLIPDDEGRPSRRLFDRHWTPEEADEWTRHDVVASVLSAACYLLVAVGVAGTLLLRTWGFVCLAVSIVCAWLMFKVIDPKLKAMSVAFGEAQAGYLEDMNRRTRWEGKG